LDNIFKNAEKHTALQKYKNVGNVFDATPVWRGRWSDYVIPLSHSFTNVFGFFSKQITGLVMQASKKQVVCQSDRW